MYLRCRWLLCAEARRQEPDSLNGGISLDLYISPVMSVRIRSCLLWLECTVSRLSSYNQEELAELDDCLIRLSTLLEKFAAAEDIASCGDFPEL